MVHPPKSIWVPLLQLSLALEGQLQQEIIFHRGQETYEVQTSAHKKINKLLGISFGDG